jgi:hypothetical protein
MLADHGHGATDACMARFNRTSTLNLDQAVGELLCNVRLPLQRIGEERAATAAVRS